MNSRLGVAFWSKAVATGAIFTVVFLRVDVSAAVATLSQIKLQWFLIGLSISFPMGFTGVQRWRCVAATFGETLPLSKAFTYVWIGHFINLGLPTVFGLDSVRAWKMHKQGIAIGLATRIVIVDRLCSLFALLIILGLGIPYLRTLHGSELFKHSAVLAFVLGSGGLVGVSAVQLSGRFSPETSRRTQYLYEVSRGFNHALFGDLRATITTTWWSTCNHVCRVALVLCLTLGLGIWVSPIDAFALVPAALLLAMVPISLAGWGVREVVFIQALSLAGVAPSDALAVSLLYGLVGLVTGLLGGAVWFGERQLQKQPFKASYTEGQG
jgi:glycosyltransferase 2 family protein